VSTPEHRAATAGLGAILEASLDCVHCGLCLESCPTYRATGRENSSPRGRIYLLRGVAEGRLALSEAVAEESFLCLDCRACETACPSGVRFGSLIEMARAEVVDAGLHQGPAARLERLVLRHVLPHRRRLRFAVGLLAAAQRLGLDRLAIQLLPASLGSVLHLLPRVPPRSFRRPLPEVVPAEGERRGRVGFFAGCIMPELFGDVNLATVRVLARNGFEVVTPRSQGCCGALHAHAGDRDTACDLARHNAAAFEEADLDVVVVNSAGCGAAMREAESWLPDGGAAYAARVRDVAEFLDDVGLRPPAGRIDAAVCYDDPCHLVHAQGVSDAPRRLLEAIPGLTLRRHDDPTSCCGAAGTYNLTHPEMSQAVLARKLDSLAAADPDVIASGNPGCLMQLRAGAAARGLRARVLHPIELLDEAYGAPADSNQRDPAQNQR
jgi:glycolate oxidase iron-sulfur subunit